MEITQKAQIALNRMRSEFTYQTGGNRIISHVHH
jgi:hypothetical protein